MKKLFRNFMSQDSGAETIEYVAIIAVVAGLIALIGLVVIPALSGKINDAAGTIDGIDTTGGGATTSTPPTGP